MIDSTYFFICMTILGVGTLIIRGSVIAMARKLKITPQTRELFTYIPAAVYPALVMPQVFLHQGHVDWLAGRERLFVLILATAVSFWLRNMLVTLIFGLAALYILG